MPNDYVIPDLHGCIKTINYVLSDIIMPGPDDRIFFLGDFINKGPDSKRVLDLMIELLKNKRRFFAVRGNHDQLFLNATRSQKDFEIFLERGGEDTMKSFGVSQMKSIPVRYFEMLEKLPYFIELDHYFIVHAGFDFSKPNPFEDHNSMLNIRNFKYQSKMAQGKTIIHGHNASLLGDILNNLIERKGMIYNIDNGCVYSNRADMGNLVILRLNDFSFRIQPNLDL